MKNYRITLVLLISMIFSFLSCNKNDKYFNGEIKIVKFTNNIDTIIGKELVFDGIYTGRPVAYDSLIFFISQKFESELMAVFSLNSLKQIGSFCKKGNGPNEFTSINCFEQIEIINSSICLWLENRDTYTMKLFKLSQSVIEEKSIFDSSDIKLKWRKEYKWPYLYTFIIDSNSYLVKNQATKKYSKSIDYIPGSYHLYNRKSNKKIQTFVLFNKPVLNKYSEKYPLFPHEIYYASKDMIKPDLSKIAMAMVSMGQLNILDLKTGEIKGFRLPHTPDFSYLISEPQKYYEFFRNISTDDDYIYTAYAEILNDPKRPNINRLLVFNWEGLLLKNIILKNPFKYMSVNPLNRFLYTIDDQDRVFSYDLKKVLK
jgi:hypothetical protein